MLKESITKLESSLGAGVAIGSITYMEGLPYHVVIPVAILGFIGGYFGSKFIKNAETTAQTLPK